MGHQAQETMAKHLLLLVMNAGGENVLITEIKFIFKNHRSEKLETLKEPGYSVVLFQPWIRMIQAKKARSRQSSGSIRLAWTTE